MASKVLISMFIFVHFVFFCHFSKLTDAFCKVICTSYLLEVVFIQIALKYTLLFGFFCVFLSKSVKNAYYLMFFASSFALPMSFKLFSSTLP